MCSVASDKIISFCGLGAFEENVVIGITTSLHKNTRDHRETYFPDFGNCSSCFSGINSKFRPIEDFRVFINDWLRNAYLDDAIDS